MAAKTKCTFAVRRVAVIWVPSSLNALSKLPSDPHEKERFETHGSGHFLLRVSQWMRGRWTSALAIDAITVATPLMSGDSFPRADMLATAAGVLALVTKASIGPHSLL
jgi:hypothetical protein